MRRILFFLFFVSAMLSLPALAKRATYGFRVAKIQFDFPADPQWDTPLFPEISAILKQPFRFLGKGAQSYVFESADQRYVIKLFRSSSQEKVADLFAACKLAFDHLREETGLVYIHLNPTSLQLPTLFCRDAIGRSYRLPLDPLRFAVQKKATPFQSTLVKARQKPRQMEARIDAFLSLLRARAAKGIYNRDPNLNRNFGFLEEGAIEFDFGQFRYDPSLNQKEEISRFAKRLRRWLAKHDPEWVAYLDERL